MIDLTHNKAYAKNMFSDYLADFLDYMEVEKGRSLKTIENYSLYLNRFYEFAGDIKVGKIDLDMVSKWRKWLNRYKGEDGREVSKTTQNYHLIALRSFLKYLARRDVKALAPEKIELASSKRPQVSFLDRLAASTARGLDKTLTKRSLVSAQGISSTLGRDPGCHRPILLQASLLA